MAATMFVALSWAYDVIKYRIQRWNETRELQKLKDRCRQRGHCRSMWEDCH